MNSNLSSVKPPRKERHLPSKFSKTIRGNQFSSTSGRRVYEDLRQQWKALRRNQSQPHGERDKRHDQYRLQHLQRASGKSEHHSAGAHWQGGRDKHYQRQGATVVGGRIRPSSEFGAGTNRGWCCPGGVNTRHMEDSRFDSGDGLRSIADPALLWRTTMRLIASDFITNYRPSLCDLRVLLRQSGEKEAEPGAFDEVLRRLGIRHEQGSY